MVLQVVWTYTLKMKLLSIILLALHSLSHIIYISTPTLEFEDEIMKYRGSSTSLLFCLLSCTKLILTFASADEI